MKSELKQWTQKARAALEDKELLAGLLKEAAVKADQNKSKIKKVWMHLKAMVRMVKAWTKGDYRRVPMRTLLSAVAAILYFLNPFDLIPDFLPAGFIDDALFIGWVLAAVQTDIEHFLTWERTVPVVAEKVE